MDRRKKVEARARRKRRIRKKISGSQAKPRLCVYKSLKEIYAQLIDDSTSKVITGASTLTKDVKGDLKYGGNKEAAKRVGQFIAQKAKDLGIDHVVFDRNGFKYHGRVAALAEGAREGGLIF